LENYIGTDGEQCRYIRGRCSYVYRTKQGKKKIIMGDWYRRMYNVITEVSHKPWSL